MPFINSRFCEPDKRNNPLSSDSSTTNLISSNIALSFCTSSIKRGQGLFKKNNLGSSRACNRVRRSSKFALLYFSNSCLTSVDFPTCLAPVIKLHLLVDALFFKTGVIARFI